MKIPETASVGAEVTTPAEPSSPTTDKSITAPPKPASPIAPAAEQTPTVDEIKEEVFSKDESEHIDVGNEFKMESDMVDVETTDRKVNDRPDLDAIIVESGK